MLNEQEIRKRVKALRGFYMDLINDSATIFL